MKTVSEYDRLLAELSADERLRLCGRDFDFQSAIFRKSAYRRKLEKLAPEDKLRLLEELRNRAEVQRGSRRSAFPKLPANRFGGRATAAGLNFEVHIAAFIAVKMLCGSVCSAWEGITGDDVAAITLQAPEPVDDIIVNLRRTTDARVFISAKQRSGTIALSPRSPAFSDTVDAFVSQFLKLSPLARSKCRLVWAVSSSAGRATTHEIPEALANHRLTNVASLSEFLDGRRPGERKAFEALQLVASRAWEKTLGKSPTEDELRSFLRHVYVDVYDFRSGKGQHREADENIRSHVVANSSQAHCAWETLVSFFANANQHGIRTTNTSLRQVLAAAGLTLRSPPDYVEDIARLQLLTSRNLTRLKDHTSLHFGADTSDTVHISRTEELSALVKAVQAGHLLITGEPGCGKSGLIHDLVDALQRDGRPVVLLLAEEVFGRDWKGAANIPGFPRALDETLANWTDGSRGFLITDALDAVRDLDTQKLLRHLLRDVQTGQSTWTVIASVREFDLKYGRELREQFPGAGVPEHSSNDFAGVAHFHLRGLSEAQLDHLVSRRTEIGPFIESARSSPKAGGVHRSPFYLRLAAELLRDGEQPARLADWNSPAVLLRKFWEFRIKEGPDLDNRSDALKAICRQMVETLSMTVSLKELPVGTCESVVNELRSRGILQSSSLRSGMNVGGDEIRFSHHLLHDYAIARSLIPETPSRFCDFTVREPLLPIFYRQSFLFALEELWDASDRREGFWECALKLESVPKLHGVTRILAPILAARRVESLSDLHSLFTAASSDIDVNSPSQKALRHLASGLQDADPAGIRAGATGWCAFTEELAGLLRSNSSIEQPLTLIIDRLNTVGAAIDYDQRIALNAAARGLLAHHVAKDVSKGWRYASHVATDTLCHTFTASPVETERSLLTLFAPERLKRFPHHDLFDLARSIKHLGSEGGVVVLQLFEAAFADEPERDQWENTGSAILSLRLQTSDSWNIIHYSLAEYYMGRGGEDASLMTDAACIAWNAVVRRREGRRNREIAVLQTIKFCGASCELIEDYGHIWGRGFEYEENRILTHFEKLLREWATTGDAAKLDTALDHFARRNRTSLMWSVFMEAGAEYPLTLGVLMGAVLNEPLFLSHPDYCYGGTALLGELHKTGDPSNRERLEKLILDLPTNITVRREVNHEHVRLWIEHAQNRLLGALQESDIVLESVRDLWRTRHAANALAPNPKPEGPKVTSHTFSDQEAIEQRGISLKDPVNEEMFRLRDALKSLLARDNNKLTSEKIETHWHIIQESKNALEQHGKYQPAMAEELWGHLVGACESIARHATWPSSSPRWLIVRELLLKGAQDPKPEPREDDGADRDHWPSWGWPAPRVDAGQGLPFLVLRVGKADQEVASALRRLCEDKSQAVRFNLAFQLAVLKETAPELMWELIDRLVNKETRFSVLDAVLRSVDLLWNKSPDSVVDRVQKLGERAQNAPPENGIHEMLAHTNLFQFLRTGRPECESYILSLIANCDDARESKALLAQLHSCREGGWLTAGDAVKPTSLVEAVRGRTWFFFSKLLASAQQKLKQHRAVWKDLHERGQSDTPAMKTCQEKLDRASHLVDGVATQFYFASGAFEEKNNKSASKLSDAQSQRFWEEAKPLFTAIAEELHPHTAYQFVQTLTHLMRYAPQEAFLLATRSIINSSIAGFQHESLAVGEVVRLIQRALADHRDIFQGETGRESECLVALLQVLDIFVEAGWSEARQLTHRLEEIYR